MYRTHPFARFARWTSRAAGHAVAFGLALLIIVVWALSGPVFHFSDTWQLIINTGTTISTFLMVFLLQNTGNRTIEEMQDNLRRMERQNAGLMQELLSLRDDLRADGASRPNGCLHPRWPPVLWRSRRNEGPLCQ